MGLSHIACNSRFPGGGGGSQALEVGVLPIMAHNSVGILRVE